MKKKQSRVTWFELPADDIERASKFYNDVFGWDMSDMGAGSKAALTSPSDDNFTPTEVGSINGDISPRGQHFDRPLIVISVDNIDEQVELVKQSGGEIVLEPSRMEEMGIIWSIIKDTEGNKVGMVQSI